MIFSILLIGHHAAVWNHYALHIIILKPYCSRQYLSVFKCIHINVCNKQYTSIPSQTQPMCLIWKNGSRHRVSDTMIFFKAIKWALFHLLCSYLHKESISLPVISTPSLLRAWWSRIPGSRNGHHLKAHAVLPAERKPNSFIFTGITLHHTSSHSTVKRERVKEKDRRDLKVCRWSSCTGWPCSCHSWCQRKSNNPWNPKHMQNTICLLTVNILYVSYT